MSMLGTASWTSEMDVAKDHLIHKLKRVIFSCETQKNGVSIMTRSEVLYEYEVLVSKGSRYKPIDYKIEPDYVLIGLEEK